MITSFIKNELKCAVKEYSTDKEKAKQKYGNCRYWNVSNIFFNLYESIILQQY